MPSMLHEKVSDSFEKRSALPRWWKRNWEVFPPYPETFYRLQTRAIRRVIPDQKNISHRGLTRFLRECAAASSPVCFSLQARSARPHGEPEKDILQPRKVNVLRPLAQLLMEMEEEPPPGPEGTSTGITALSVKPGSSSSFCGWKSRIPHTNVFGFFSITIFYSLHLTEIHQGIILCHNMIEYLMMTPFKYTVWASTSQYARAKQSPQVTQCQVRQIKPSNI